MNAPVTLEGPDAAADEATDAATEAAIGWLVVLNSGAVSDAERAGFAAWLDAVPGHRAAWERLAGPLQDTFAPARAVAARPGVRAGLLGDTLARAEARTARRRRLLRGALGLGGMAAGAALLAERQVPLAQWSADLRTGTGERLEHRLPDGSVLTLDARSAADLDFGPGRRTVVLRQGALVADVRAQAGSQAAPFIVRTAHGEVRALGTRFVVRRDEADSYVGMLEHRVEVTAVSGQRLTLEEGRAARFGPQGVAGSSLEPLAASAWRQGLYEAHDQPLGDVVEAMRAYRRGLLRVSPRAAALHVYGSYALDDTDRALAALAETLPIQVRIYRFGWLVVIE